MTTTQNTFFGLPIPSQEMPSSFSVEDQAIIIAIIEDWSIYRGQLKQSTTIHAIDALEHDEQTRLVSLLICWMLANDDLYKHSVHWAQSIAELHQSQSNVRAVLKRLIQRQRTWSAEIVTSLLQLAVSDGNGYHTDTQGILHAVSSYAESAELSSEMTNLISQLLVQWTSHHNRGEHRFVATKLRQIITKNRYLLPIIRGEAWANAAITTIYTLDQTQCKNWCNLILHCQTATKPKPLKRWLKAGRQLREQIGQEQFIAFVTSWFQLLDKPRPEQFESWPPNIINPNLRFEEGNIDILKGLVWLCADMADGEVARAVSVLVVSAYRKVPQIGARSVRLGNAGVWALGQMPTLDAVGQLALLKVKIKFGTAQKSIEKALTASAEKLNLPRSEIEELAVPTYGLTAVGYAKVPFGDYHAELIVDGKSAEIHWFKPNGKRQKSVPKFVRTDHADTLKTLRQQAKDIRKLLPAQKQRIEAHYLLQSSWPLVTWRERYHNHPLVGTIARRLIWQFEDGDHFGAGIWNGNAFVNSAENPLNWLTDTTTVKLWHPINAETKTILQWRQLLEKLAIQQPFKQAHREIYLLTDAERNTDTYSNRFVAHILKQHQFNALCTARGWKNKLRLMVDDFYPPASLQLPKWNLRAEFWIEGIGDNWDTATNDAGTYLYLTTDQVRFYPLNANENYAHAGGGGYLYRPYRDHDPAQPLPLESIPPFVFSEVMRDVDLFVGVASVGNDPEWQDGGPEGHYQRYWRTYSFGELSISAETRKQVLQRLIPRLKIADQCQFSSRYLIVEGKIRTYKIHLGSGNILMEPNDQYLCIVASQSLTSKSASSLYLPFEGDRRLSIILSKAILLANDTAITDPTITRQINRNLSS